MNYNSIMNIGQTLYRVGVWDFDDQFEVEELEIYSVEFYNNETYYKSYPFSDLNDNTICEEKYIDSEETFNDCRIFSSKEKAEELSHALKVEYGYAEERDR